MFAIVAIGGKQYKVSPNDIIDVDRLPYDEGAEIELTDVLLKDNDGDVVIGQPVIEGAKVKAKVLKQYLGEKIEVRRFKAKVRYRRKRGFRPSLTKLQIESIA